MALITRERDVGADWWSGVSMAILDSGRANRSARQMRRSTRNSRMLLRDDGADVRLVGSGDLDADDDELA